MGKKFKISLLQCKISESDNLMNQHIEYLVRNAVENSPDIIVLPERWRPIPNQNKFNSAVQEERGKDYNFIQKLSKEYSTAILSGGIWEKRSDQPQNKPFITCYYFDENGDEIGRQDKLHLYSYEPYVFQPGKSLHIFEHKKTGIKFTILICFDIAFYETPRLSVENGAELLISPTLIREDGLTNWKIYLQARALENRIPVAACNPIGNFFDRHFPGKSKVISFKTGSESPVNLLVKELAENQPGILTESINISFPNRIRKKRIGQKINIDNINLIK